jgi:hypothetical protein
MQDPRSTYKFFAGMHAALLDRLKEGMMSPERKADLEDRKSRLERIIEKIRWW